LNLTTYIEEVETNTPINENITTDSDSEIRKVIQRIEKSFSYKRFFKSNLNVEFSIPRWLSKADQYITTTLSLTNFPSVTVRNNKNMKNTIGIDYTIPLGDLEATRQKISEETTNQLVFWNQKLWNNVVKARNNVYARQRKEHPFAWKAKEVFGKYVPARIIESKRFRRYLNNPEPRDPSEIKQDLKFLKQTLGLHVALYLDINLSASSLNWLKSQIAILDKELNWMKENLEIAIKFKKTGRGYIPGIEQVMERLEKAYNDCFFKYHHLEVLFQLIKFHAVYKLKIQIEEKREPDENECFEFLKREILSRLPKRTKFNKKSQFHFEKEIYQTPLEIQHHMLEAEKIVNQRLIEHEKRIAQIREIEWKDKLSNAQKLKELKKIEMELNLERIKQEEKIKTIQKNAKNELEALIKKGTNDFLIKAYARLKDTQQILATDGAKLITRGAIKNLKALKKAYQEIEDIDIKNTDELARMMDQISNIIEQSKKKIPMNKKQASEIVDDTLQAIHFINLKLVEIAETSDAMKGMQLDDSWKANLENYDSIPQEVGA